MKPFQERNPATIGLIGFAIIAALLFVAFRADKLPIIGGGDIYRAEFSEVGGLKIGNEVRIAGVTVGKVDDVQLDGNKVVVSLRIKTDSRLGVKTRAAIKIRTLLGATYVGLEPVGPGNLPAGSTIPLARTTAPYDVVQAFTGLSDTTSELNLDQVSKALRVLGETVGGSAPQFHAAVDGLSRVSRTLGARDDQINQLLTSLDRASAVLSEHSTSIEQLLKDSNQLFAAVAARRDQVHLLLTSAQTISKELQAVVKSSRADLKPALDQLTAITDMLVRNQDSLDQALRLSPSFYGAFADTLGSGPWFDVYSSTANGGH